MSHSLVLTKMMHKSNLFRSYQILNIFGLNSEHLKS